MKKVVVTVTCVLLIYFTVWFFGTGLVKNSSAFIESYTVSEDGSKMTLTMGVGSSVGYLRKVSARSGRDSKLYLDCYAAFGGINGRVGAKRVYTFFLQPETKVIALYRAKDCYEEVLVKDADANWVRK